MNDLLPAIEGWMSLEDGAAALVGLRCATCGTYAFPPTRTSCPNPSCGGTDLDRVPLSRTGRLWSWTVNHYAPPAPYVSPEPFEPYGVAAVELSEERIVVLGQVAPGVDPSRLELGREMELVPGNVLHDDGREAAVWNWRPA